MPQQPSSNPHPREAIAERNLAAILDAAERLMSRGESPSVSAVAVEAGVSRPTVYAHFADRQQLVEAVVERTVSRVTAAISSAEPGEGAAQAALARLVSASWAELSRHELIGESAARELSAEAMHRAHHAALSMLHQLLERGQLAGDFRSDVPATVLVSAALALIHTTADAARQGVLGSDDAGEMAQKLIGQLWRAPG